MWRVMLLLETSSTACDKEQFVPQFVPGGGYRLAKGISLLAGRQTQWVLIPKDFILVSPVSCLLHRTQLIFPKPFHGNNSAGSYPPCILSSPLCSTDFRRIPEAECVFVCVCVPAMWSAGAGKSVSRQWQGKWGRCLHGPGFIMLFLVREQPWQHAPGYSHSSGSSSTS